MSSGPKESAVLSLPCVILHLYKTIKTHIKIQIGYMTAFRMQESGNVNSM